VRDDACEDIRHHLPTMRTDLANDLFKVDGFSRNLALVRAVAGAHDGDATLDASADKGAAFAIDLGDDPPTAPPAAGGELT